MVKTLWVIVLVNSYKIASTYDCFVKAIEHILYRYTGIVNTLKILGEHFSILPISQGHINHKPIENICRLKFAAFSFVIHNCDNLYLSINFTLVCLSQ